MDWRIFPPLSNTDYSEPTPEPNEASSPAKKEKYLRQFIIARLSYEETVDGNVIDVGKRRRHVRPFAAFVERDDGAKRTLSDLADFQLRRHVDAAQSGDPFEVEQTKGNVAIVPRRRRARARIVVERSFERERKSVTHRLGYVEIRAVRRVIDGHEHLALTGISYKVLLPKEEILN